MRSVVEQRLADLRFSLEQVTQQYHALDVQRAQLQSTIQRLTGACAALQTVLEEMPVANGHDTTSRDAPAS
jgi:prefoldin subunit 5